MRPTAAFRPLLPALGLLLAACGSVPAARPAVEPILREAEGSPQAVLTRIKADAVAHGWRIAGEGLDSLVVDFGTSAVRVRPAEGPGRNTEVHGSALFVVRPAPAGTEVVVIENPIAWDLDRACWVPGPAGLLPSAEILPPDVRGGTR